MGVQCGTAGANRHTVFDWYGNFRRHAEERGVAATSAGRGVVDYGRDGDALPNPHADYFVLMPE